MQRPGKKSDIVFLLSGPDPYIKGKDLVLICVDPIDCY